MRSPRSTTGQGPSPVVLGLLATVLAGLVFLGWLHRMPDRPAPMPPSNRLPQARLYVQPHRPIEYLVNQGDGQTFAALATDPTLAHPELFSSTPAAAYRAQRPLIGWLTWATTGGGRSTVPYALAAWTVLGVGLLVGATAWTARRLGRVGWPALLLVGAPGVIVDLEWLGPEALGAGLAMLGLGCWLRPWSADGRWHRLSGRWAAVGLFALAGLARETLLVVPVSLAVLELVRLVRRPGSAPGGEAWRAPVGTVARLAVAPLVYVAWLVVIRVRLGAWSFDAHEGRLSLPFVGLSERVGAMSQGSLLSLLLLAAGALLVFRRRTPIEVRAVAAGFIVLGVCMGSLVWVQWQDFSRPLLPLLALAVLALAPAAAGGSTEAASAGDRSHVAPSEAAVPVG